MQRLGIAVQSVLRSIADRAFAAEVKLERKLRAERLQFWQPAEHPTRLLSLLSCVLFFMCAWSVGLWVEWGTPLALVGPILIPVGVAATVRLIASTSSRHSLSVAAVVVSNDGPATKVLMIRRRDNGQWQPPGGRLDADETIAAGLMREVREETGLHVVPILFSGVYRHVDTRVLALVFLCEVTDGRVLAETTETTECRWLELDELDRVDETFSVRLHDAIRNYQNRITGQGRVCDHNGVTQLTAGEIAAAAEIVDVAPLKVEEGSPEREHDEHTDRVPPLYELAAFKRHRWPEPQGAALRRRRGVDHGVGE